MANQYTKPAFIGLEQLRDLLAVDGRRPGLSTVRRLVWRHADIFKPTFPFGRVMAVPQEAVEKWLEHRCMSNRRTIHLPLRSKCLPSALLRPRGKLQKPSPPEETTHSPKLTAAEIRERIQL